MGADHDKHENRDAPAALWLLGFVCLGLALGGSLAHLYELPHKMSLTAGEYLVVQQLYGGWNLLGGPIIGVLLTSLVLTLTLRKRPAAFRWALATFAAIAAAQSYSGSGPIQPT